LGFKLQKKGGVTGETAIEENSCFHAKKEELELRRGVRSKEAKK